MEQVLTLLTVGYTTGWVLVTAEEACGLWMVPATASSAATASSLTASVGFAQLWKSQNLQSYSTEGNANNNSIDFMLSLDGRAFYVFKFGIWCLLFGNIVIPRRLAVYNELPNSNYQFQHIFLNEILK